MSDIYVIYLIYVVVLTFIRSSMNLYCFIQMRNIGAVHYLCLLEKGENE